MTPPITQPERLPDTGANGDTAHVVRTLEGTTVFEGRRMERAHRHLVVRHLIILISGLPSMSA